MIYNIALTDTWQQICTTSATKLLAQATDKAILHIHSSAPAANATGFVLNTRDPLEIPHIATLGGGVWAKGVGRLRYASDAAVVPV